MVYGASDRRSMVDRCALAAEVEANASGGDGWESVRYPEAGAESLRVELSAVLGELKLADKVGVASAWCGERGFGSVSELLRAERAETALVEALELKSGEAKDLRQRLQAMRATD